jgi:putative membrane protein
MDRLKGALAGIVGGLAGTYAMSEFQGLWSRVVDGYESRSAGGRHDARDWQERSEDDNANEAVAQAIAKYTVGRTLDRDALAIAAPAVHYAFGSAVAACYGAAAEATPEVRAGAGAGLGIALWAAADEVAMPLLGLSEPTSDRAAELHLQAFAAHVVYGLTTEAVRRVVRRALG